MNLKRDRSGMDEHNKPDLTGLSVKRIIDVGSLRAVTKSLNPRSIEFIIHVPSEYDYRYSAKNDTIRDEIINALKLAFLTEKKDDLVIYGVPDRYLGKYTKTSKGFRKNNKIPEDNFLLQEEKLALGFERTNSANASPLKPRLSLDSDELEIIPYEEKEDKNSLYKKAHSDGGNVDTDEETNLKNITKDHDSDQSCGDEEQKILDEISDDENEISFNLDDEDFDIFCERSETIYSKKNESNKINAKDFALKKLLRSTDHGKVYLAEHTKSKKLYALKSIKRDIFVKKFKTVDVLKELSDQLDHPFICNIEFAIQNEFRVYLISDLLKGGELSSLIKSKTLDEEWVKFYAAQLALALGFMHEHEVIYRNLKTSNIMIGNDGYIKIGDFDSSKINKNGLNGSILNLSEYQAPEVIHDQQYDYTVDWWALGIVMSQMLFPEIKFSKEGIEFPESTVSEEGKNLISKLLERDKKKRLGAENDKDDVLSHNFFSNIDINSLLNKTAEPPYKPFINPNDPYFVTNFNSEFLKQPPRESVIDKKEKERISREVEQILD
ncbi:unnamed protein product [Moneuplotes crassus]|uniref:Uncharacterized protein n=1 Tax=Euplotes crassus TaxID=5936 RepID=A0AAD1U4U0_EUPCR|nr:unnamed protein product [Moneuplotes crassus]